MAKTGERNDPYPGFRFVLQIGNEPLAGFSDCSGLDLELEVEDYPEGGENRFVHKFPGRRKQTDLVLKRGIVGLESWNRFIQQELGEIKPIAMSLIVKAFDEADQSLVFEVHDAFPSKWQGPELNATSAAVAMETLTLTHQGLRIEQKELRDNGS